MTSAACQQVDQVHAYALATLSPANAAAFEAHLASCIDCRRELESLQPAMQALVSWPADVIGPSGALQVRLAERTAAETGAAPVLPETRQWSEPAWKPVAPGIECKLLAKDARRKLVSMLVRLEPGARYPSHVHAGVEELHLLDGELWIEERKLYPGDYSRAEPGTGDQLVWSETGCTCVLITSTDDILR
jgi:anti-sigma factor ChrR (cupin superfamily)